MQNSSTAISTNLLNGPTAYGGEDLSRAQNDNHLRRLRLPFLTAFFAQLILSLDVVTLFSVSIAVMLWQQEAFLSAPLSLTLPYLLFPLFFIWSNQLVRSYQFTFQDAYHFVAARLGFSSFTATIAVCLVCLAFSFPVSLIEMLVLACGLLATQFFVHFSLREVGRRLHRQGVFSENVLIVGATENARKLIASNKTKQELNIVGIFDDRLGRAPEAINEVPVLGKIDDLLNWQSLPDIDRIIISVSSDARERVRSLIDRMRGLPQTLVLLLELDEFDPESQTLEKFAQSPGAYVSGRPVDLHRVIVKRVFDVAISLFLLITLSPLLFGLALLVRLDSPGPVLFRQKRQGFNNQIIRVWKFRTMKHDPLAENRMREQTVEDDPRVTRIGRILRMTSLDELPQLVNVLRGDMSLVGPRPHALGMTTESTEVQRIVEDYAHRHRVKPGLTGWAQINGSRGPVHTKEEIRERVRYDLEYVNRSSIWFDVYILLMTLPCLLGDRQRQR